MDTIFSYDHLTVVSILGPELLIILTPNGINPGFIKIRFLVHFDSLNSEI